MSDTTKLVPDFDKPYQEYLDDQTKLTILLAKFQEKLRQGQSLDLYDQILLSTIASGLHRSVLGREFKSRQSRSSALARHFYFGVCTAAFHSPPIADRLENAISPGRKHRGWVLSADIRNSAELMRRAKDPQLFATFLSALSERLNTVVTNPCGYFDKFTGDGCLGFLSDDLCGEDCILFALDAATSCHNAFWTLIDHYSPRLFDGTCPSTGLGVGLAYGEVQFVEIANQKSIVGESVVWACRLSGCPAGRTYLTRDDQSRISDRYPQLESKFRFARHFMKSQGHRRVAWWHGDLAQVEELELRPPDWVREIFPELKSCRKTPLEKRDHR